ncbi:unnamed protein product [Gordionus sp. m RMFG-2023]
MERPRLQQDWRNPQIQLARKGNEIIWSIGGENIYARREEETDCFTNSANGGTKDQLYLASRILGNNFTFNFDSDLTTIQGDSIKKQFLICYYIFENFKNNITCTPPTPSNARTNLTQRENHIIVTSKDDQRSIENSFILRISGDIKIQGTKHKVLVLLHTCPEWKDQICSKIGESGPYNTKDIFPSIQIPDSIPQIQLERKGNEIIWSIGGENIYERDEGETNSFTNSASTGTKDQLYLASSILGNDFAVNIDSDLTTIQENSIKKQFLICYYRLENSKNNVICTVPTSSNAKTNLTQGEDHIIVASNDVRRSIENSFVLGISGDIKVQGTKHKGLVLLHTCPDLKDSCDYVKESNSYNMQEIFNGPEIPFTYPQMIELERTEIFVIWNVEDREVFKWKVNLAGIPDESGQKNVALERQSTIDDIEKKHQVVQEVSDIVLEERSMNGNLDKAKTYYNSPITYLLMEYHGTSGLGHMLNVYIATCYCMCYII